MSNLARKCLLALALYYAIIAGAAALYFNIRVFRARGPDGWLRLGQVEATLNGIIWPYTLPAGYVLFIEPEETRLNRAEWAQLQKALPSFEKPVFTEDDRKAAQAVIDRFTERTGRPPRPGPLLARLQEAQAIVEWRAEAATSIGLSWNRRTVVRTPRLLALSVRLPETEPMRAEQRLVSELIAAASTRKPTIELDGQTVGVIPYTTTLRGNRLAASAFDTAIAALIPESARPPARSNPGSSPTTPPQAPPPQDGSQLPPDKAQTPPG